MSVCVQAIIAARIAEMAPTHATRPNASGALIANTGNNLATRNTPATTIVAACINAETGVGPSIASGNQICNGNIALFPAPPMNTRQTPHVNAETPRKDEVTAVFNSLDPGEVNRWIIVLKSKVPEQNERIKMPIKKPRSANRVTTNAFFDAATADGRS